MSSKNSPIIFSWLYVNNLCFIHLCGLYYFPALCGMNRGLRQILRFCMVVYWILLPLVPTLAVALSMQLGYSLGWMSAVLCVQCVLTLLLFVVFQIKKWKLQGERNRQ